MRIATEEEIRKAITPKSDQLNADDLIAGPITVTIENVRSGDDEQPIIIDISGHRPYKPCKSMLRVLSKAYTIEGKEWIGKRMTLFRDPSVMWGGVRVGGIRISHLSGLKEPTTFQVTISRTKRLEILIYPLDDAPTQNMQALIDKYTADITAATSLDALKALGAALKGQPKVVQDAVRGIYGVKQKALAAPATNGNGQISATLKEWKAGVQVMTTLESCAEFRRDALPDCPEDIRAAVEHYLNEHEAHLKNGVAT